MPSGPVEKSRLSASTVRTDSRETVGSSLGVTIQIVRYDGRSRVISRPPQRAPVLLQNGRHAHRVSLIAMRQVKVCESLTLGGEGGFGGVQEVGLPHRHGIGAWVGGEKGGNIAFHMLEGER